MALLAARKQRAYGRNIGSSPLMMSGPVRVARPAYARKVSPLWQLLLLNYREENRLIEKCNSNQSRSETAVVRVFQQLWQSFGCGSLKNDEVCGQSSKTCLHWRQRRERKMVELLQERR